MEKIAPKKQKVKAEKGWIKFIRFLIYVVSIIGVIVGASLIKTGELSAAYAGGTYAAKIENGEIIFFVFLIILCGNIMWGILRWFLRGYREKWKPGRVIGKLIGGGIWRTLAIVPLALFSFLVIAPKIADAVSAKIAAGQNDQKQISLSEPLDRLEYISEHLEDWTFEELEEELAPYFFKNIDFGVDASANVSKKQSPGIFTQNVSAYASSVTVLNKAKLSSKGNFVIFYTDTGDDAVSDEKISELAEMLEGIIAGYEEKLGLKYKYEKFNNYNTDAMTAAKMKAVLAASGIEENDTNFSQINTLETAMPVYLVNPYKEDGNVLASYAGRRFAEYGSSILVRLGSIIGEETARLYDSTPSYPFVNILPENVDSGSLAIVTAHELGHHYMANYSYDNYGSIGSDDDFIGETTPNWMAINVLPNESGENLINKGHYKRDYLEGRTGVSINRMDYNAVAFLENYYEVVPDAKNIIMDATYYGDALNYLYDKAGEENFQKVMVSLAEKNLTGEYGGKLMNYQETRRGKKYTLPKGEEIPCTDLCTKEYTINPAATEYLYFTASDYHGAKLTFSGPDGVMASILGKNVDNQWQIMQSGMNETEFEFTDELAEKYGVIAFAVANSNIDSNKNYEIGITSVEFERLIAAAGEFDFEGLYTDLGQGCFEIDFNSLFDLYGNFMDLGGAVLDVVAKLDDTADYFELQNEWAKEAEEVKGGIEEARQNVAKYRISVCANYIAKGQTFDKVKETLQRAMGWNMNLYEERSGTDRMNVFFGFDLLTRQGKIYVLAESNGEMGLITINIAER